MVWHFSRHRRVSTHRCLSKTSEKHGLISSLSHFLSCLQLCSVSGDFVVRTEISDRCSNESRAENGIAAYIVETIDENTSKVIWILNVDLKVRRIIPTRSNPMFFVQGWLPQYLINSSLASVQLAFVVSLRNYLSNPTEKRTSTSDEIV